MEALDALNDAVVKVAIAEGTSQDSVMEQISLYAASTKITFERDVNSFNAFTTIFKKEFAENKQRFQAEHPGRKLY